MKRIALLSALALFCGMAQAQPPAGAVGMESRLDFEDGRVGFQPFGDNANISITHEAKDVKEGRAALRFDYTVAPGQINQMLLAGQMGEAAGIKSIGFWVKADAPANFAMILQEHGAGRYVALFHAPKDKWQRVELSTSDFMLASEKNDPVDPDNKLDMELVETASIFDFNQIIANMVKDENFKKMINFKTGPRKLFMDDFQAVKGEIPPMPGVDPKDRAVIDAFVHPQIGWLAVGDVLLTHVTEKELADQGRPASVKERGLQAEYSQLPGQLVGLGHPVRPGQLTGMAALKFTVASEKALTLVVQLEETSGGKYSTTVDIPGDSKATLVRLVPNLFGRSPDSNDDNDKLDLAQVKQILFIDPAGLFGQPQGATTLWLSDVRLDLNQ